MEKPATPLPKLNLAQLSALYAIRDAEMQSDTDQSVVAKLKADLAAYEKAMGLPSALDIQAQQQAQARKRLWVTAEKFEALTAINAELVEAGEAALHELDSVIRCISNLTARDEMMFVADALRNALARAKENSNG